MKRLVLAVLIACGAPAPVAVAVPPVTPAPLVPVAPVERATPGAHVPPHEPRPIALAGPNGVENAAWVEKGVLAAVTHDAVWRVRPEQPELVAMQPLAGAFGGNEVIAASDASSLVAVALDDGRVDVLDVSGRKQTLAGSSTDAVLDLRFSPDFKVLAVTRSGPTWKDETTFFDLGTGSALGKIEGGNVVFDPTSKYVAGRGGISSLDGKAISKWKEGFFVLGSSGKLVDISSAGGGEVMAADYVARGWFKGRAFYAGDQTVDLVDPATGAVTSIEAKCGTAPGKKISSTADPERGRVIGVCEEAILITDLASGTTKHISVLVQKGGFHFAVPIYLPADTPNFAINSGKNGIVVDAVQGTARVDPSARAELSAFMQRSGDALCMHSRTPRKATACSIPARRRDGAFVATAGFGLFVHNGSGQPVIEWRHPNLIAYRSGRATLVAPAGCGATPAGAGRGGWSMKETTDAFTAYTSVRAGSGRVLAHVTCICTATSCAKTEIAGFADEPLAFLADGTVLTTSTNPTMTETVLTLRRPGKPPVHGKVGESCIRGVFGPNDRVFAICDAHDRTTVYELSPKDLGVIAKRAWPPFSAHGGTAFRQGDDLVLNSRDGAMLVPADWVKDASLKERAMIYEGYGSMVRITPDGKVDVKGAEQEAEALLRCYDGEHLRPWSTCR